MKYHTADGHEIVRDGVYYNTLSGLTFTCLGFKSDGQECPIIGFVTLPDGSEDSRGVDADFLILSKKPAAPETVEVWEVVVLEPGGHISIALFNRENIARGAQAIDGNKILTIRLKETITVGGV